MGRALSIGVEDIRPSGDAQSLLIPESPPFKHGEYVKAIPSYSILKTVKEEVHMYWRN